MYNLKDVIFERSEKRLFIYVCVCEIKKKIPDCYIRRGGGRGQRRGFGQRGPKPFVLRVLILLKDRALIVHSGQFCQSWHGQEMSQIRYWPLSGTGVFTAQRGAVHIFADQIMLPGAAYGTSRKPKEHSGHNSISRYEFSRRKGLTEGGEEFSPGLSTSPDWAHNKPVASSVA